jgi:hypothetical protein
MSLRVGSGPSVISAAVVPSGEIAGWRMKDDQVCEPLLTRPLSTDFGAPVPSTLTCSRLGIDKL